MLDHDISRLLTDPFYPGSHREGNWDKGSDIKFLAGLDGKSSGIQAKVVENIPYEYVSVEYTGVIVDGQLDTHSAEAGVWLGARENYRFTENNGVTTVEVKLSGAKIGDEMVKMFEDSWPKSLNKLKQICEQ